MENKKEFLGRGWAFPVRPSREFGSIELAAHEVDVQQAIRIILGTAPGERLMHPGFGCGIHDLVFEVIDSATIARIENIVTDSLTRYEPRIELREPVRVDPYHAAEGRLEISVAYRVRNTNQVGNLVYPFYFREGQPA